MQAKESSMEPQIWFQQDIRCFVQESLKMSLTVNTLSVTSIVGISELCLFRAGMPHVIISTLSTVVAFLQQAPQQ